MCNKIDGPIDVMNAAQQQEQQQLGENKEQKKNQRKNPKKQTKLANLYYIMHIYAYTIYVHIVLYSRAHLQFQLRFVFALSSLSFCTVCAKIYLELFMQKATPQRGGGSTAKQMKIKLKDMEM